MNKTCNSKSEAKENSKSAEPAMAAKEKEQSACASNKKCADKK